MSKASSIPIGTFARTTVAGKTATKVGMKKIAQVAKRPFMSKDKYQVHKDTSNKEIAQEIFAGLSQLRGTALKIAQLFSMETDILPEALRRELAKSHYQVPPLNRAMIRRIIKSQYGKNPEDVFESFLPEAFAAASLGQVHRARSFDGDDLAVKVQYPGIGRAVDNDVKLVKGIVSSFYKTKLVERIFKEISERLKEEVDYVRECEKTRYFHDHLPVDGVIVPEPIESLCRKEVLVTRYIEGKHLREWLAANPSQETRNHYAQVLYEHYMRSLYQNSIIHSDPNPGNFLFCPDGRLGIIDYGCTKAYDNTMIDVFRKIVTSGMNQDEEAIKDAYRGLAVEQMDDKEYDQAYFDYLKPLSDWLGKPYQAGRFDFKEHPGYCAEGVRLMTESMKKNGFDKFTTETMFLDRYFYGIYRIFDEMGAEIYFNVDMVM